VSSLLLILVIGQGLSEAMERLGGKFAERRTILPWPNFISTPFLDRMKAIELSLRGDGWAIAALGPTCWMVANGGKLNAKQLMDAHFDGKRFPEAAIKYLQQQNVQGPIVSPDDWGVFHLPAVSPCKSSG